MTKKLITFLIGILLVGAIVLLSGSGATTADLTGEVYVDTCGYREQEATRFCVYLEANNAFDLRLTSPQTFEEADKARQEIQKILGHPRKRSLLQIIPSVSADQETRTGQDFPDIATDTETFLNWLKLSSSIRIYLPSGNRVDYSGERLRKLLKQINCYERVEPSKTSDKSKPGAGQ